MAQTSSKLHKQIYIISALCGAILLLVNTIFVVDQRFAAIVFQFGEAVRIVDAPGINVKIPFIQNHQLFDKRLLVVDAATKELTASDGKRIIVDAFLRLKIVDPVTFYKTVNNYQNIQIRLSKILEGSMRKAIGRVPLITLLSDQRSIIMAEIRDVVNAEAKNFGVTVVDVRIMHADLPVENSAAIYTRMQAEREKEARQIRAEGEEKATEITSTTDKDVKVLLAEMYVTSQTLMAEGDATAAEIYNNAYSKDSEFYKFYKSLEVYRNVFKDNASFIISPNSSFMEYLEFDKK